MAFLLTNLDFLKLLYKKEGFENVMKKKEKSLESFMGISRWYPKGLFGPNPQTINNSLLVLRQ